MPNISPWPDFETWKNDGLSREYNKINPASLQRSDNKIEKSWYKRGRRKGWNSNFIYESRLRIIPIEFKNKSQWKEYGIERGYNQKNSTALKKSNDPLEKYWHYKGSENKWLSYFPFLKKEEKIKAKEERRRVSLKFDNQEMWLKYGLDNKFDERNSWSIENSKNINESAWLRKGRKEKWNKNFPFKKAFKDFLKSGLIFENYSKWEKYGIDNEFNQRNSYDLKVSKILSERSWYYKGRRSNWLNDFNFKEVDENSNQQLESLLENYVGEEQ